MKRNSSLGTRPGTAMSEKWDDLDEAERIYLLERRDLRREQELLMEQMSHEVVEDVPIVELKALPRKMSV